MFEDYKDEVVKLREEGLGVTRIAKELEVSKSSVKIWLKKLGLNGYLNEYKPVEHKKVCEECGSPFVTRHDYAKYCSERCRSEHNKRYYRESGIGNKTRECKWCNKSFNTYSGGRAYCSSTCSDNAKERANKNRAKKQAMKQLIELINPYRHKQCEHCGNNFYATRTNRKYCSDECRYRYKYENVIIPNRTVKIYNKKM